MPPRIRPATSPDPDGGFDLATSFNVLIGSMQALGEHINQQTQMMSRQLDAQGLVNSSANVTGEESSKGAGNKAGVSLSQYQKQHPGTTGGGVTVNLSAEAKQLLKLLPSNSDQAAASSTVPTPPYVASPSR